MQSGNFWLTAGFAAGSIMLTLLLLAKGRFAWGWLETVIELLVLVCLKYSGPKTATVATTVAILIAGLPGLIELWRNPQPAVAHVWAEFAAANLLAFFDGTEWSLEERFAPGSFAVQTLVLVLFGSRRKQPGPTKAAPGPESMKNP